MSGGVRRCQQGFLGCRYNGRMGQRIKDQGLDGISVRDIRGVRGYKRVSEGIKPSQTSPRIMLIKKYMIYIFIPVHTNLHQFTHNCTYLH